MSRDHRKLKAFELADALVIDVYRATQRFPTEEKYGLVSQIRRAVVSVPTNIVEGCGRTSHRDYVHFLQMAFASLREVGYLLDLSARLGFIPDSDCQRLRETHQECSRVLAGLLNALQNAPP